MKAAEFLNKYHTIIFDMDGVITSEQNYWDIAALSVYELITDSRFFGSESVNAQAQERKKEIRARLFANDRFITAVKEKGVNSNWDLAYLALCYLAGGRFTPEEMCAHVENSTALAFGLYEEAAAFAAESLNLPISDTARGAKLWLMCRDCFQEWYLGDRLFAEMWGERPSGKNKTGMWQTEDPIVPLNKLRAMLAALSSSGKALGIATGRNRFELNAPLERWNCKCFFTPSATVDYDYVTRGEAKLREAGIDTHLTKPHPYMFLKSLYGIDYDDVRLYNGDYDKGRISGALIVGDAGSDILAAKAMGADFLAVLTGISGEKGRRYFEETGAEYILPNVLYMAAEE